MHRQIYVMSSWHRSAFALIRYLVSGVLCLIISEAAYTQYVINYDGDYDPQYEDPVEVLLSEDELSEALAIGFDFTFFDNTYSEFYISSNGFITFDPSSGSGSNSQFLPDPSGPNDLIAAAWGSLGNDYSYFTYETLGSAPDRHLHVDFYIEKYADGNCDNDYYLSSQIVLYESSGIIEIHTGDWSGDVCEIYATQGIENANGSIAVFDEFRNYNWWNTNSDYIAFIPGTIIDVEVLNYDPTLCEGIQDINILVRNLSSVVIDTMYFDWEWQGIPQSAVMVSFPFAPESLASITLGQKTIAPGVAYALKAWSYNPDNETDDDMSNDTLVGTIHAGISGSRTIGGVDPDYATIAEAISDLQVNGVCDSVVFNIRTGVYAVELDFSTYTSTPGGYAVFQSETGNAEDVLITKEYNSGTTNRLVELNNLFNLRFRHLSFSVTGTACANVFYLNSFCTGIHITDCILHGSDCDVSVPYGATIFYGTGAKTNCVIKNNTIVKGSHGIYVLPGLSSICSNLTISENTIDSAYRYAILMTRTSGMQLNNNNIFCPHPGVQAISMVTMFGDITASGNLINAPSAWYGWSISGYNGSPFGTFKIYNNMINLGGDISQSRVFHADFSSYLYLWHNTFNSNSTLSNSVTLELDNVGPCELYNNIFSNSGAGIAAAYSDQSADYNDYYTVGTPILSNNGIPYNTLIDWQNASSEDLQSHNVDPEYLDPTSDLHIQGLTLDNAGIPLTPPILIDIDGQVRSLTTPDIGADEFGSGGSGNWPGGSVVFVDIDATGENDGTSWGDAFTQLRDAVDIAGQYGNIQEIWIAEGVYTPHLTKRDTSFVLTDSMHIYGGFLGTETNKAERTGNASLVVLSGDINTASDDSDNSYHVVLVQSSCVACILDGLTISSGHSDLSVNSNNIGGGILSYGTFDMTNIVLENNYALNSGAAIYSTGTSSEVSLSDCVVRLNTSSTGANVVNTNGAILHLNASNSIEQ